MDEKFRDLIPDKDGFLFEIVDDNYMIGRLWGVFAVSFGLLFILSFFDFNIIKLAHSDYRGHYIVFVGIPWMLIESIRIYIYIKSGNYKKIKFYEIYIENSKSEKLFLEDLIDIYLLKCNFIQNRVRRISPWILIVFPIVIYIYICFYEHIFIQFF